MTKPHTHRASPTESSRRAKLPSRRKLNTLIRRLHLYLGLTLVPWVLLYGTTALMFNHGDWFTERDYATLPSIELTTLPSPQTIAEQAVDEIGLADVTLVEGSPRWLGNLSFRGAEADHRISARVHPLGHGGTLRAFPNDAPGPEWSNLLNDWDPLSDDIDNQIIQTVLETVQSQRPAVTSLTLREYPTLRFSVRDGAGLHHVDLEFGDGMEVTPAAAGTPLRNKLLRLHVMHGDPGYRGARWLWVRIVDIMGISMILWGCTGLLMWWTIRPARRTGAVAVGFGFLLMTVLATSLWAAMGMT